MRKLEGNRTLPHREATRWIEACRTSPVICVRLAHLIVRTDVVGPCAYHSNQITAVFLS